MYSLHCKGLSKSLSQWMPEFLRFQMTLGRVVAVCTMGGFVLAFEHSLLSAVQQYHWQLKLQKKEGIAVGQTKGREANTYP